VGFFGRGEPRKGLHLALRAWLDSGAAEGGRFVLAGAVEPAYRDFLEPLLAHPSVQDHGHLADPAALMRGCDVLVLPSVEEGSALVTYEARACGCVLVVSDRTGAPCTDGVDALVHRAGDLQALTSHLRTLDQDRDLLGRLRSASLEAVVELTWANAGRVLAGVYETALGR
jgi:glycosyltransferase involved in cell wall biosynthesis